MKLGSKFPDSKSKQVERDIRPASGNHSRLSGRSSGGSRYGGRNKQPPIDSDELFSQMGVEERHSVATRLAPSPTGGDDWGDDDFDVDEDISNSKSALERYGKSGETDFGN